MIKKSSLCALFLTAVLFAAGQQQIPGVLPDTSAVVNTEVTVYAYGQRSAIINTPAAVSLLDKNALQRFESSSFVPAMNAVPGIKMDERSPGSYRISIRGNLLRSTFGVRNVKVYLNGLPYTDASGNTYFNQLSVNTVDRITVIKGPGGSMYGAGTGGVILLDDEPAKAALQLQVSGASYGLFAAEGKMVFGKENARQSVSFTHQTADGYRDQAAMRRDVASYNLSAKAGRSHSFTGTALYSNLFYETPGGLTLAQFAANPRQARPATPVFRSAADQHAAIYLSTLYASVLDEITLSSKWKNFTGVYFTYTDFKNPTIRNYEKKNEKGTGARTVFQYESGDRSASIGAEYQYTFINTGVFNNDRGVKTTLQYRDKIDVRQVNVFAQAGTALPFRTQVTAGISYNNFYYGFNRVSIPLLKDAEDFTPQYIPRITVLKKITTIGTAYLSYSRGYSPPTIDEIHASDGRFNKDLGAERAANYEGGLKLNLPGHLRADVSVYLLQLRNTIVSRRDAAGADFFVNAGSTKQKGLEFSLSHATLEKAVGLIRMLRLSANGAVVHARFENYTQGLNKFSGNRLTGTSPFIFSALADARFDRGVYSNITYTYTDKIPLNDANTFYAKAYNILYVKAGKQMMLRKSMTAEVFATAQVAFNKNYSLGNDLNADANRFYNPSARQVFGGGLAVKF